MCSVNYFFDSIHQNDFSNFILCSCTMCMPGVHGEQKRTLDLVELQLQL